MHNNDNEVISTDIFQTMVESSSDALLLFTEQQELFYANEKAKRLLAIPDFTINQTASDVLPGDLFSLVQKLARSANGISAVQEADVRFPDGSCTWVETSVSSLNVGGKCFQQLGLRDIDVLKQRESQLQLEAATDYLSGLSNRRQFRKVLDQHADDKICLAVVDVDNFKSINDCFGHVTGDAAIRFVAEKLLEFFADEICVARLGGEEFGVVLNYQCSDDVVELFESFRKAIEFSSFTESNSQSEQSVSLTVSIGLAFSCQNLDDVFGLLVKADEALYQSKETGRNRVSISS